MNSPVAAKKPRKTVLVIDDSATIREVVTNVLKEMNYEVLQAVNGMSALSMLDGRRIHLMICDVNMPLMDGIEFVRMAKTKSAYRFTPIIMLTTESEGNRMEAAKKAGARAYLYKPFRPEKLKEVLSRLQ